MGAIEFASMDGNTSLAADLNDLWLAGEGESWSVEHTGYGHSRGEWLLVLNFTSNDVPYDDADDRFVTTEWRFYGPTVDSCLIRAIEWCSALLDLSEDDSTRHDRKVR